MKTILTERSSESIKGKINIRFAGERGMLFEDFVY